MRPDAKIGILAGGGGLPLRVAEACRSQNREVFAVVFDGQGDAAAFADRDIAHSVVRLGAAGKTIVTLRDQRCDILVMAGTIRRPSVKDLRPDLWAVKFLAKSGAAALGDDGMLRALIGALEKEGFEVVGADAFLPDLLMPQGPLGRMTAEAYAADVEIGIHAARRLGAKDQGQAVVVRDGTVIAEEDARGTDAMLQTLAAAKNAGGVLCKTLKPSQERRADLPTVGALTVENAHRAGLHGIAVEAGNAFLMDADETQRAADSLGLFVVGVQPPA